MQPRPEKLEQGKPYPLGATWDGLGVNFAVFSASATRIELCLFEQSGRREIARFDLPSYTDEAHVKGFTQLLEKVPRNQRGTFAALCHSSVIDHLKRLGATAIELLPVHAFLQDRTLLDKGLNNYWGYNTLSYFAPEPRYLG